MAESEPVRDGGVGAVHHGESLSTFRRSGGRQPLSGVDRVSAAAPESRPSHHQREER